MSQSADPLAQIQSVLFHGWAAGFTAWNDAISSVLITVADWAYEETEVHAVNSKVIPVDASIGAVLAAAGDFVLTEGSEAVADPTPEQRIPPDQVRFEPTTVPAANQGETLSEVIIFLEPDHDVEIGEYVGRVTASDVVLPDDIYVYVDG